MNKIVFLVFIFITQSFSGLFEDSVKDVSVSGTIRYKYEKYSGNLKANKRSIKTRNLTNITIQ